MRAMQSSTVAGTWCRKEQFVALRFISQHFELSAGMAVGSIGLPDSGGVADTNRIKLAAEAGVLLRLVRECKARLAANGMLLGEDHECSTELGSLRDRSWALMRRFVRCPGVAGSTAVAGGAESLALHRLERLEEDAAGWIAC